MSGRYNLRIVTLNTSDDDLPAHVRLLYSSTIEDSDLNSDLRAEFKRLLSRHASTFASSTSDIGFCSLLQHDIDTQDIKQSPRRPPIGACQAEDDILNEMLKIGVIEPSTSACMHGKKARWQL